MDKISETGSGPRAEAMRLFALAPWATLDEKTRDLADVEHSLMRGPEIGLIMLRGRMGATGNAFNVGETTVDALHGEACLRQGRSCLCARPQW